MKNFSVNLLKTSTLLLIFIFIISLNGNVEAGVNGYDTTGIYELKPSQELEANLSGYSVSFVVACKKNSNGEFESCTKLSCDYNSNNKKITIKRGETLDESDIGKTYYIVCKKTTTTTKSGGYKHTYTTISVVVPVKIKKYEGEIRYSGGMDNVTNIPASEKVGFDGYARPTNPSCEGYKFVGWERSIGDKKYEVDEPIFVGDEKFSVFGLWEKIEYEPIDHSTYIAKINEEIEFNTTFSRDNNPFTSNEFQTIYNEEGEIVNENKGDNKYYEGVATVRAGEIYSNDARRYYYFKAKEPGIYHIELKNENTGKMYILKFNIEGNGGNYVPETDDNGYIPGDNNGTPESIETTEATEVNKAGKVDNEIEVKDKQGNVIATIFAGEEVAILEKTADGKYYKIKWEKDGVYASKSYLNNNITKGIGPNIRTEANGNSKKIGDIKAGQTIERVRESGDYVEINFAIEGYVDASKIEEVEGKNVSANLLNKLFGLQGGLFESLTGTIRGGLSKITGIFNQKTESNPIVTNSLKYLGQGIDYIGNKIFGEDNERGSVTEILGAGIILFHVLPKIF